MNELTYRWFVCRVCPRTSSGMCSVGTSIQFMPELDNCPLGVHDDWVHRRTMVGGGPGRVRYCLILLPPPTCALPVDNGYRQPRAGNRSARCDVKPPTMREAAKRGFVYQHAVRLRPPQPTSVELVIACRTMVCHIFIKRGGKLIVVFSLAPSHRRGARRVFNCGPISSSVASNPWRPHVGERWLNCVLKKIPKLIRTQHQCSAAVGCV